MSQRSIYTDFDLVIEQTGGEYYARVINSPAGQAVVNFDSLLSPAELEIFTLSLQLVARPQSGMRRIDSPEMERIKNLGARLFEKIFKDEVLDCYQRSLDLVLKRGKGLRIRLQIKVPDFNTLPWEYLYNRHADGFLALSKDTPIVRYIEVPRSPQALPIKAPLKILAMISSPKKYPPLNVEEEWDRLNRALKTLIDRGLVVLQRLENPTLSSLQKKLRQGEVHIFHFIGHGRYFEQEQDGKLLLEDENHEGIPISGRHLGAILHDHHSLRLVVINACEGARTASEDPYAGVAQSLVRKGIPAVVAMQFPIFEKAAIILAHEFYGAIADGYPVDAALSEARKAIFASSNDVEWGTPVLFMQTPKGILFNLQLPAKEATRLSMEQREADKIADENAGREAEERKAQEERASLLNGVYVKAKEQMEEQAWAGAMASLLRIQGMEPDFRDVGALLEQAGVEQARLKRVKDEEARLIAEKLDAEQKAKVQAEELARQQARDQAETKEREEAERLERIQRHAEKARQQELARERAEAESLARQQADQERLAQAKLGPERPMQEKLARPADQQLAEERSKEGARDAQAVTATASARSEQRRKRLLAGGILGGILGLIAVVIFFSTRAQPGGGGATSGTLKIVSSLPMTGALLTQTQSIVNAMEMRIDEAGGEACGGKYSIVYEAWDDASAAGGSWDPAVETENANKAAADPSIIAYLGPFDSGAARASIPILNQAGPLVMISPANLDPGLTKPDKAEPGVTDSYYPAALRNYTRVVAAWDVQGRVAAYFVQTLGAKTVYILDDQGPYGKGVADSFEETAREIGLTVLGREGIDTKAADYKSLMTEISTSNAGGPPDAIYASMDLFNNAAQLLKDKVSIMGDNMAVKYVAPDGLLSQSFIDGAGAGVAEGTYVSDPLPPIEELGPKAQQFKKDYEAKYGPLAERLAPYGYEAMNAALKGIEDVCAGGGDPTNREEVRAAVFAIKNFDGVLGTWSFDANGDTSLTDTTFYQLQSGGFEVAGTLKEPP